MQKKSASRLIGGSLILVMILLITGCSSSTTVSEEVRASTIWNLDDYPLNVFMGVSAPYSTREKEVAEALYNCARSIAIHDSLQVTSKLVSEFSSEKGLLSFATDGRALYSEDDVLAILDRLELLEVRDTLSEGVVVIAADPQKEALSRPYVQQVDSSNTPTWIEQLPEIPGYLVAVGQTLGYQYMRDSWEAADVLAAEALIEKSSAAVTGTKSYALNVASDGFKQDSSYYQEGLLQVVAGNLEGFVILARWYDITHNRYYSLAASERN